MENSKVFEHLIETTENYIVSNGLDSMVLGISGGIDSTVCAAICHEVSLRSNRQIKFIGRSLPIKNQVMHSEEYDASKLVGNAFCDDFRVVNLSWIYENMLGEIVEHEEDKKVKGFSYKGIEDRSENQTPIANGNIQARLRMTYLYNLAGINKGLVIDTDNLTEHYLGFFTIHGDQGDFNPIGGLWKTEVYQLAKYIAYEYKKKAENLIDDDITLSHTYEKMYNALWASIRLTPTDGLGISNSDLEQIGADNYNQVDDILQTVVYFSDASSFTSYIEKLYEKYNKEMVDKVVSRYVKSDFKRKKMPIVIPTNFSILDTMEGSCMF
jgi:NAD+ synthetase